MNKVPPLLLLVCSERRQYSDYQYLASLIRAMGNTYTQRGSDTEKIAKQVTRYINIEKLIPSHHNVITVACLQVRLACSYELPPLTSRIDSHRVGAIKAHSRGHSVPETVQQVRKLRKGARQCVELDSTHRR